MTHGLCEAVILLSPEPFVLTINIFNNIELYRQQLAAVHIIMLYTMDFTVIEF